MTTWQIAQTARFEAWLDGLVDLQARGRITDRIERAQTGNLGDHASVGGGVGELRIHYGPGYRLYYTMRGRTLVLLLAGGTKATQKRDIRLAKDMAAEL